VPSPSSTRLVSVVATGGTGVTSAQERPARNSSHCMAAGTLAAVFCRILNRSMARLSVPVVFEMKPVSGSEAEPKVAALGLIHRDTALGKTVKSYLTTRRI